MDPSLLIGLIAGGIVVCIAAAVVIGWGIAAMTSPSVPPRVPGVTNPNASKAASTPENSEEQFTMLEVRRQQKNRRRRSSRKSSSRVGSRV